MINYDKPMVEVRRRTESYRILDDELSRSDLSPILPFVGLLLSDPPRVESTSPDRTRSPFRLRSPLRLDSFIGVISIPITTQPSCTDLFDAHRNANPNTPALRVRFKTGKRSGR
jgi:hypothetical protein